MRLYHHPFSSSARRAVVAALHLDAPVELVEIGSLVEPAVRQQIVALNPNGKIPVLVDEDFVLWESNAIMQYLADMTPGQTVYPTEPRARLEVNRWLFWCAQHWAPALGVLVFQNVIKPYIGAGEADPAELKRGEAETERFARVLDAHLARRQWIAAPTLTLADFAIASPLIAMDTAKLPLQPYAHIMSWFARVQALDAWKRAA